MKKSILFFALALCPVLAGAQPYLQSQTVDVSRDFGDFSNTYFFAPGLQPFGLKKPTMAESESIRHWKSWPIACSAIVMRMWQKWPR